MKFLALILALSAISCSSYNYIETKPEDKESTPPKEVGFPIREVAKKTLKKVP